MVIDFDTLSPYQAPAVLMKESAFPDTRQHFSEVVTALREKPVVVPCGCCGPTQPPAAREPDIAFAASEVRPFHP